MFHHFIFVLSNVFLLYLFKSSLFRGLASKNFSVPCSLYNCACDKHDLIWCNVYLAFLIALLTFYRACSVRLLYTSALWRVSSFISTNNPKNVFDDDHFRTPLIITAGTQPGSPSVSKNHLLYIYLLVLRDGKYLQKCIFGHLLILHLTSLSDSQNPSELLWVWRTDVDMSWCGLKRSSLSWCQCDP